MTTQHYERANLRLMPCPFCGENSDLHVYEHHDDAYVQCRECTTCGPDGGDFAGAVVKWNTRAALLAADAQAGGEVALWVSPGQFENLKADHDDESGTYLPVRHTSRGKFTMPLYTHPQPQAVAQGWIPVNQQMPKSGQIVLALQKWDHSGKLGVIRAAWIAAKTEESSPESDIGEYDESTDTYYDPEGWYEQISHWDEISAAGVSGATIVAWMPLPNVLSASPASPAAAQVAQPLTEDQAEEGRRKWLYGPVGHQSAFIAGVRYAEAAHGIGKD